MISRKYQVNKLIKCTKHVYLLFFVRVNHGKMIFWNIKIKVFRRKTIETRWKKVDNQQYKKSAC